MQNRNSNNQKQKKTKKNEDITQIKIILNTEKNLRLFFLSARTINQ